MDAFESVPPGLFQFSGFDRDSFQRLTAAKSPCMDSLHTLSDYHAFQIFAVPECSGADRCHLIADDNLFQIFTAGKCLRGYPGYLIGDAAV